MRVLYAKLVIIFLVLISCGNPSDNSAYDPKVELNKVKAVLVRDVRYKVHVLCIRHDCDQGPLINAITDHILKKYDRMMADPYQNIRGSVDDVLIIANTYRVPAKTVASILYEYELWDKGN